MIQSDAIIDVVADEFKVSKIEILSHSRHSEIVRARFMSFYLMQYIGYTLAEIARKFKVSHVSVIHGIKSFRDLKRDKSPEAIRLIFRLSESLQEQQASNIKTEISNLESSLLDIENRTTKIKNKIAKLKEEIAA